MASQTVFSRRLRQARIARGLSQKTLGLVIGLDPGVASTRINRYEQAVHLPDFSTLERLAKALTVPLAYLFARDDPLAELILQFGTAEAGEESGVDPGELAW